MKKEDFEQACVPYECPSFSLAQFDVNIPFDSFLLYYIFLRKDIKDLNLYTNWLKLPQQYEHQGGVDGYVFLQMGFCLLSNFLLGF